MKQNIFGNIAPSQNAGIFASNASNLFQKK